MISYLLKTLVLAVFSFVIAYFYYFSNTAHIENFDGYMSYVIVIGIIYGVYKFFQLEFSGNKASFSLLKILGFFLLHLLVLCILFFSYNKLGLSNGIVLFFKIIYYSIFPLLIIFSSISFGQKIISYFKYVNNENSIYKFVISLGIGFFSFVYLLDIVGFLGFYNLYVVFLILAGFIAFSYKEFLALFNGLLDYKIEIDIEEGSYLKLISTEFLFLVSTLLLSVNLISIVRPFPIGWDDLGVYMNFPHLMAEAGSIISLGSIYPWQTLTGIGYMFGSPTLAFFINNIGGFLSFILVVLITSDLLKTTEKNIKKTFINIPLLVGTLFIAMPMVVFQQAKDMKLDAGLFFVSIISLYLLFRYYLKIDNNTYLEKIKSFFNDKILHKGFHFDNLLIILVIGILAGFAFTIKLTSLLLICAIIGLIFFARLGTVGFIGFLSIFFAVFTKANLWAYLNVVVNPSNIPGFTNNFFMTSGLIGVLLLTYSFSKNKLVLKKVLMELGVLILGIILAILPWVGKNLYDSYPNVSIGTMLSGHAETFETDYTKIYTQNELDKITQKQKNQSLGSEGTTINEDMGRYFGYERGANNYIKLPWNLTMQVNQGGEFTDIGFLFLALLPAILLFLPYRRKYYSVLIVIILLIEILTFIKTDNKLIESSKLSSFSKMSEDVKSLLFQRNNTVFSDKLFNKDVYDIKVSNYITKSDIQSVVSEANDYKTIEKKAIEAFYSEISGKVTDIKSGKELSLVKASLKDSDFELIKELRNLNTSYTTFNQNITSINDLKELISKKGLSEYNDNLLNLWKNNRTIYQSISDFLSSYNLPFGYLIILLSFFIPILVLLYVIDSRTSEYQKINLFKLNLIFASFYTFLWNISAFGIVWYGIVMYFSFLLAISIGLYYLSSYQDENDEKEFFMKLFGSTIFIIIVLIYIVNSIIPHTFLNLKTAGYEDFKTGTVTTTTAPYLYHQEYLKILYYLNIDQNKKEEFLNEFIKTDIKKAVSGIDKMDINTVNGILTELIKTQPLLSKSAKLSLNDIYENISNPIDKYKNKSGIYRIGTFLKYHISENNIRLLEDGLLFTFEDYFYNKNSDITIDNIKKMGVEYLLVDLNAATIDKDARHNLTKRYEKLLDTFKSNKLELVETDSVCLKVALDDYNKSSKTDKDNLNFRVNAGVNYESYSDDGTQINRNTKLLECFKRVKYLIDNGKIDNENYPYLLNLSNYMIQNKSNFPDERTYYTFLQQQIPSGYKVLFKIK